MRNAEDRAGDILQDRREQREQAQQDAAAGASPAPAPDAGAAPPEAGGSEAPPSNAGDESPDRQFPVPPVPPPPSPGPIFSLAGGGGGGAASFARPGTAAARPFRSPIFTANRSTASSAARFGAGTAVTAGGASSPSFLPAGLAGEAGPGGPAGGDDELRRIMAVLRGGGAQ